jgi:hypothetical protein
MRRDPVGQFQEGFEPGFLGFAEELNFFCRLVRSMRGSSGLAKCLAIEPLRFVSMVILLCRMGRIAGLPVEIKRSYLDAIALGSESY